MPDTRDFQRALFRQVRRAAGDEIPDWLEETPEERMHRERTLPRGDRMEMEEDDAGN